MSKDIKKALEHCINNECVDCPNNEELGSGEIVCRARLLPEVLEYVADLEAKLAESERKNFELLTKLNLKEYAPAFCTLADRDCEALGQIEELKQKAIVPKFQIGQTLYMIPTQSNKLAKIKEYYLLSVSLSDIGIRYDLAVKEKEKGIEPFYCASEDMFDKSIFATKEEAEQKLALVELKGEEQ